MTTIVCGGIVDETTFYQDPLRYMMARILKDLEYKDYVKLLRKSEDRRHSFKSRQEFKNHAHKIAEKAWSPI